MSLLDVLEYRAAGSSIIVFDVADLSRTDVTVYARPFGATQWGYYSGAMEWDAEYRRSHEPVGSAERLPTRLDFVSDRVEDSRMITQPRGSLAKVKSRPLSPKARGRVRLVGQISCAQESDLPVDPGKVISDAGDEGGDSIQACGSAHSSSVAEREQPKNGGAM